MKDKLPYIIILLILLLTMFLIVVYFAIPKAASLTLPYKWNRIPLEQKQKYVHQYLGKPVDFDTSSSQLKADEWVATRENGKYVLTVYYDKDSVANNYTLLFNYQLGFFKKSYDLKPDEEE
jgi:hypothetical protein